MTNFWSEAVSFQEKTESCTQLFGSSFGCRGFLTRKMAAFDVRFAKPSKKRGFRFCKQALAYSKYSILAPRIQHRVKIGSVQTKLLKEKTFGSQKAKSFVVSSSWHTNSSVRSARDGPSTWQSQVEGPLPFSKVVGVLGAKPRAAGGQNIVKKLRFGHSPKMGSAPMRCFTTSFPQGERKSCS